MCISRSSFNLGSKPPALSLRPDAHIVLLQPLLSQALMVPSHDRIADVSAETAHASSSAPVHVNLSWMETISRTVSRAASVPKVVTKSHVAYDFARLW